MEVCKRGVDMIISLEEAKETLRVDGEDNDQIIEALVRSIPSYLEVTTGKSWVDEDENELARTTAKFVLSLWFDPQGQDSIRLKRTIDNLLTALTALGRDR